MPNNNIGNTSTEVQENGQGVWNANGIARFGAIESAISHMEMQKILHYLRTEMKVGIELEKSGNYNRNIDTELGVVGDYSRVSKLGIAQSVNDGSISGREWLYSSVNENFWAMHSKMVSIHEILSRHHMKATSECGLHMHMMTLQKWEVPDVVMRNIIQMFRIYAPGLIYLTKSNSRTTNHYASWSQLMSATPLHNSAQRIVSMMGTRYCAINMGQTGYYNTAGQNQSFRGETLDGLHFEVRFPDANDSPTATTAFSFMFRAIVDKAVQLSEFGVIDASSIIGDWTMHKQVVESFNSNGQAYTSESAIQYAKDNAKALIKFIYSNLKAIDGESEAVLRDLADSNIYDRAKKGKSPKQIEKSLCPKQPQDDEKAKNLRKLIVSGTIEAANPAAWKDAAQAILGYEITRSIMEVKVKAFWDGKAKSFIIEE